MTRAASRFTQAYIDRLASTDHVSEMFVWDSALPGFGVRVFATGRVSWIVQYRSADRRQRRAALGDVRRLSLGEARGQARAVLAQVALGHDPQAERHKVRQASTVLELVNVYLPQAKERRKPGSYKAVERALRKAAKPLHHLRADKVGRREVVALFDRVKVEAGPVAANRVRAYLSAMWNWGLRSGVVEGANPVAATLPPAREKSRDRVLTEAELSLIWRSTGDGSHYSRIVRLLMLTAQRRDEIGAMDWGEVTGGNDVLLVLAGTRTKNGHAHEVPLTPLALQQLPEPQAGGVVFGRGNGFSAWSISKARLDHRMKVLAAEDFAKAHGRAPEPGEADVLPWRLHDLRRTFATWANEVGGEPHIVEAILNHLTGAAKSGVAGVYNRAVYRQQKRQLVNVWSDYIDKLTKM